MAIPDSKTKYLSFGCSYTEYGYPTYASFLGQHFDIRENLGMCGAGNRYIFHKLIATLKILDKADVKFTENDLITIQWSGLPREDKILTGATRYPTCGYIGSQNTYSEKYVRKYFSIEQNFLELINYIHACKIILENLGCQYKMFYMMDFDQEDFLGEAFQGHIFNEQFDNLATSGYLSELKRILPENIESLETYRMKHTMDKEVQYCYSFDDGNGNIETCDDTHPHPYTHHEYAKYLSTFLKEDLMKKNPRDYSELFKFTDGMFIREAVEKSRVPINEVFPDYAQFGVIENNFSILSKYRGADIVPYLEDYKPLL